MKKILVIMLVFGFLLTAVAFAAEEEKSDFKVNLAARYYPTSMSFSPNWFGVNFDHSNIWLEGNLFVGKDLKWKGTVEWFGAGRTKFAPNLGVNARIYNSHFIGRIGYDLWEKTYLSLDYMSNRFSTTILGITASQTNNGIGFGIDKDWKLGENWNLATNLHYYPSLTTANRVNYHVFEYEAGFVYKIPKSVNIDFGFRGENWRGYNNAAGNSVRVNGPYIGVSKDF